MVPEWWDNGIQARLPSGTTLWCTILQIISGYSSGWLLGTKMREGYLVVSSNDGRVIHDVREWIRVLPYGNEK